MPLSIFEYLQFIMPNIQIVRHPRWRICVCMCVCLCVLGGVGVVVCEYGIKCKTYEIVNHVVNLHLFHLTNHHTVISFDYGGFPFVYELNLGFTTFFSQSHTQYTLYMNTPNFFSSSFFCVGIHLVSSIRLFKCGWVFVFLFLIVVFHGIVLAI